MKRCFECNKRIWWKEAASCGKKVFCKFSCFIKWLARCDAERRENEQTQEG